MKLLKNGFTLVEIIISIAIISISGMLLNVIMINSTNVSLGQSLKVEQGLDMNNALSQIKTHIKQSAGISSYYPNSQAPVYTTSSTQLILNLPSIDSSNQIILGSFDSFVFFQSNNLLKMKSFPDAQSSRKSMDQILSNKIDSVKFTYLDNSNPSKEISPSAASKVRITINLKQKKGLNFETSVATEEANIRN